MQQNPVSLATHQNPLRHADQMNTPVTPVGTWIGGRAASAHSSPPAFAQIATRPRPFPPPVGRRTLRGVALTIVALVSCLVVLWPSSVPLASTPEQQTWTIDVMSNGAHPVRALAYGREAGLHIITVPPKDAPIGDRRSVPARLGQGDVYLLSLGWSNLAVATSAPEGLRGGPIELTASARMLRFYRNATGTFVRTSWR